MNDQESLRNAMLNDLDLQWRDHFHMRDQSWKAVANSLAFFLGAIGLEAQGFGAGWMMGIYVVVFCVGFCGLAIARHHKSGQHKKFAMIEIYERELGLLKFKEQVITDNAQLPRYQQKAANVLELAHVFVMISALILLFHSSSVYFDW